MLYRYWDTYPRVKILKGQSIIWIDSRELQAANISLLYILKSNTLPTAFVHWLNPNVKKLKNTSIEKKRLISSCKKSHWLSEGVIIKCIQDTLIESCSFFIGPEEVIWKEVRRRLFSFFKTYATTCVGSNQDESATSCWARPFARIIFIQNSRLCSWCIWDWNEIFLEL